MYPLSCCTSVDTVYNSGDLLSITFYSTSYYGGAHPISYGWTNLFDIKTGETLTASNLLLPENPDARSELAGLCAYYFPPESAEYINLSPYDVSYDALADDSTKISFTREGLTNIIKPNYQPTDAFRIDPAMTTLPYYKISYLQGEPDSYSVKEENWES